MTSQHTTSCSELQIPGMDCPAEERLVRLALEGEAGVISLFFDLPERRLRVVHSCSADHVLSRLQPLGLGARLLELREPCDQELVRASDSAENLQQQAVTLKLLLAINAIMFLAEVVAGWIAESTGLIADSLDMLADAMVYGLSLYAVGRSSASQKKAAHLSGWFQVLLALGVLAEVARRAFFGSAPDPPLMMGIAFLALLANVSCLLLLARHREGGAHMKASWIFSTNDVIANLGVILAALLVAWLGSPLPDLLIGLVIGSVVLVGGIRILRL